jgi:hypothetical protein
MSVVGDSKSSEKLMNPAFADNGSDPMTMLRSVVEILWPDFITKLRLLIRRLPMRMAVMIIVKQNSCRIRKVVFFFGLTL